MDIWEKVQTTEKSNPNKQTLTEASNLKNKISKFFNFFLIHLTKDDLKINERIRNVGHKDPWIIIDPDTNVNSKKLTKLES